jgi:GTP cyclohydrolase II
VDAGRSPPWVLSDHAKDQLAHFSTDWFSSDCLSSSRDPTPVQSKPCPMPPYDCLRRDQDQRSLPARPNFSQNDPEQPVDGTQSRARSLGVQSQQLLPKGEVLQEECFSGAKDGDDPAKQILKARKHQGIIAKSEPGRCASKSLILRMYGIVASHRAKYSVLAMGQLTPAFRLSFPGAEDLLLRIDSGCETGQLFGDRTCECHQQLDLCMQKIMRRGHGLIINIPFQDGRGMGLPFKLATLQLQLDPGVHTVDSFAMLDPDGRRDIRNYAGVIAILKFLDHCCPVKSRTESVGWRFR